MAVPVSFATAADGLRIAHAVHGNGPPLVFVRGWITHLELSWNEPSFRRFFECLGERLTVVRYDTRGNGLSARPPDVPDLDALVLDVEAVVDATGFDRFSLWGSCFGGPVAIAYAARHPERVDRLILEGTYPTWVETRSDRQVETARTMIRLLRSSPDVAATMISFLTDPEPGTRHEDRGSRLLASIEPDYLASLYALASTVDVQRDAASLRLPTLVLHPRDSRVYPSEGARLLAAAINGAQYAELPGAQHNPWEGDVDAALAAMCRFMDVPVVRCHVSRAERVSVILFTDLVGSTDLADRAGDVAAQQIRRDHDEIVTSAVRDHQGRVVKFLGDGALSQFATVTDALDAALAITSAVDRRNAAAPGPALVLRLGINAGEPIEEDGDLHGSAVNLASRVCAAAGAGEILVTATVKDLSTGKSFEFDDRGIARLKGFVDGVQTFAVRQSR